MKIDLKLKKQFRVETNLDVFVWDENNNVAFTKDYVDWLESKINSEKKVISKCDCDLERHERAKMELDYNKCMDCKKEIK
tara:strand:+ start:3244 stop:3483 length:240 start_codon:yes stop_codon:yes gene_type:complete